MSDREPVLTETALRGLLRMTNMAASLMALEGVGCGTQVRPHELMAARRWVAAIEEHRRQARQRRMPRKFPTEDGDDQTAGYLNLILGKAKSDDQ